MARLSFNSYASRSRKEKRPESASLKRVFMGGKVNLKKY